MSEETVEIPAWVAREARRTLDEAVERTGGPEASPIDASTPLAALVARLERDHEEFDAFDEAQVESIRTRAREIARNRGVELNGDPLADVTFRARNELVDALEEADDV